MVFNASGSNVPCSTSAHTAADAVFSIGCGCCTVHDRGSDDEFRSRHFNHYPGLALRDQERISTTASARVSCSGRIRGTEHGGTETRRHQRHGGTETWRHRGTEGQKHRDTGA